MSQSHRLTSRVSSDFSIERILAEDSEKKSRESSRVPSEESACSVVTRQNIRDNPSKLDIVVPNFNVDSCARLQFTDNKERVNFYDSEFVPDYSGISRATNTTECLATSRETLLSPVGGNVQPNRSFNIERNELSWLQCTRYRPPKLPRKTSTGKTGKRRPGAHPRIPFTTIQLQILEDKYRSTAYLSRRDVLQLSTTLRLPQSRVKIWFQNRRARDRRETGISGGNFTIISDDASAARKSLDSPIEKSPSTNPL